MTANKDIKTKAKEKGAFLWEIADRLGMLDIIKNNTQIKYCQ